MNRPKRNSVVRSGNRRGEARSLLRILVAIASFCAVVLAIACLSLGQSVLVPVAMALLLTFLLSPVVGFFQRRGLNRVLSVLVVVALTAAIIAGAGGMVMSQVLGLARDLRYNVEYKQNIRTKLDELRGARTPGFLDNVHETIDEITEQLASDVEDQASVLVRTKDPSPLAPIRSAVEPLLAPLSAVALVAILVIFMLFQYEDLRNRMIGLAGPGKLTTMTTALAEAGQLISHFLRTQLIVNGIYGLTIGAGLFLFGMPFAFMWAFLAGVLRYVPYIGPWVAALFPMIISMAAFPGWTTPALVAGLFLTLELVSNLVVEPLIYGNSVGVSQVALLVATGFWAWLWGPVGLLLATPLTVCIIVLGRHVPQLRFFELLLGNQPALATHASYYQRLLARDLKEASVLVQDYLRGADPVSVYDEVLIPAIRRARQDRKNEMLDGDGEAFVLQATRKIMDQMTSEQQVAPNDHAPAASDALEEHVPRRVLVFGCPAHQEAEELIVRMLQQVMALAGCQVEAISTKTHSLELMSRIRREKPSLVFFAVLPGGLPQVRYQCKILRREFQELQIVVGYWGKKKAFDKVLVRLRQCGAGYLTTSLAQTRARITALTVAGPGPLIVSSSGE